MIKKIPHKSLCPCASQKLFSVCCGPFLNGAEIPSHPEQLMRSRYTAYFLTDLKYIQKTMQGKALLNFNLKEALVHAKQCRWISLNVLNSSVEDNKKVGTVEFMAEYRSYGKITTMHEKSEFHFIEGKWFYVSGVFV
jgi:SEC-C motif-containing protein